MHLLKPLFYPRSNIRVPPCHVKARAAIGGGTDRATVRILNRFCADDITPHIVADDGKQYFALRKSCSRGEHAYKYFHFRSLSCDSVKCLSPEVTVGLPPGYRAENSNVAVPGYCGTCPGEPPRP
ncbi:MAG: transcriptional repressor [Lewinella sp.]|nr:transcriptional repressor [Lewinella sp.]